MQSPSPASVEALATPPAPAVRRVVTIRPAKGWQAVPWRELWEYRDLVVMFAMRDVMVRYKQAVLGVAWALLQPAAQVLVFTVFFGVMLGVSSRVPPIDGRPVPYAVFAMAGTVVWNFFAAGVTGGSNSLLANADILRKIYMPRLVMPLAAFGAPLMDGAVAFGLLLGAMAWYGVPMGPAMLLTPLWALSAVASALGVSLFLAALTVSYRDFKYVVPFMVQTLFFITPVIFPRDIVPERYSHLAWLLDLNPMSGVITAFRASVLGAPLTPEVWASFAISSTVGLVALVGGLLYFTSVERRFADVA